MHLKKRAVHLISILLLLVTTASAQSVDSTTDKVMNFPSKLFGKIRKRTADLNQQLTQQTEKYLKQMMKQEQRMQKKLNGVDSNAAKNLFANSQRQYAALLQKFRSDTGSRKQLSSLSGTYQPYMDSLQGSMAFLQKNPQLLSAANQSQLQGATTELQAYQAKMQDAGQAQAFIQQRKQQISQYISQHTDLQGLLNKPMTGLNQQAYYYSQQLRQYREMWDNPDQMEQKALSLLNRLPAFQNFMKDNSQLGGLFSLPGGYGTPQGLTGLQTRDQVAQSVQNQVAAGGSGGAAALQSNLSSAQSQLDGYKDKLSQLGSGNGDIDMPGFKPNDQKTKTFWKRLDYGTNFQTTHDSHYFPTVTDLGLSLGYKLGHSNEIGIGASYKVGWGNGIRHIALSGQGVGLRSFIDVRIKNSFSATGGFEYNYTTPFSSYSQLPQLQNWTKSGLIGVTKTVSMKSRFFKKTTLSLLWDFLSYQQVPRTQAILFRIGYKL
jgi:hypothetical protein